MTKIEKFGIKSTKELKKLVIKIIKGMTKNELQTNKIKKQKNRKNKRSSKRRNRKTRNRNSGRIKNRKNK